MALPIPTVGIAPGPLWATLLNNCLTIIDGHSHVPGSGVPITTSAIDINADLSANSFNITLLRSTRYNSQSAALAVSTDLGCIYNVLGDLYYNDGAGNQIRLTQAGSIVGTAGSITGLPSGTASASYNAISATFVWGSSTGIKANMDMANALLRNQSPNSTFALTLQAPAALGSNYALTFPLIPAQTNIMSLNTSGQMAAAINVDNSTIQLSSNTISIKDQGVTQIKLAPRASGTTVPAGGLAISANSGVFSTTSAGYATVTNLAVTVTTTGRPVYLTLGSATVGTLYRGASGGQWNLQFLNVTAASSVATYSPISNTTEQFICGSFTGFTFLPAGTYTFAVQVNIASGPSAITVDNCVLVAYEL